MAAWGWLLLLTVVLLVAASALILRRRGTASPRAEAAGAAAFGVETGQSVRLRVYRILGQWAGVDVAQVPPDTKRAPDLWRQSGSNPQLADGHLADLVGRLKQEFSGAELNLRPGDLRDGGLATIDRLVRHVERRTA